ncbi:hypothetical protein CEE44_02735 [Candidatus Woesearchaeota archaeon B3_Woes]|nr:MAG: hypothetical protein CEE44_02735 [Candidatus Woesearchaeota archaeon B3_Woes]
MVKKRGQSGGGAAGLVAIIAGLIILYILFLEPAERADLLGEEGDNNGNVDSEDEEVSVLLDEEPGRLDYLKGDEFEIDIPSFKLYKTTNAKELEVFNDFSIRKGWFDEKIVEKSFFIDNLDNSDNIILSFSVRKHSGVLSVDLNGNNIYESLITTQNVEPIKLRKQYFNDEGNTLKFSVSGVGLAFWSTNEYNFEGVKIIGDVTDISRQKTKNIFTLEPWKYNNLEKATLKFHPDCKQNEVGTLDVMVNNINVFSGVPDCGMLNRYEVPVGALDAGINNVIFMTNEGSYLIDLIEIDLELEELSSPLYWFEISEEQMENIMGGVSDANLTLEFVDDDENKELDINVNGHMRRVDQEEPFYEKQINSWVEEGRNYVKLIPKTTVDIVSIQIELIEKDDDED